MTYISVHARNFKYLLYIPIPYLYNTLFAIAYCENARPMLYIFCCRGWLNCNSLCSCFVVYIVCSVVECTCSGGSATACIANRMCHRIISIYFFRKIFTNTHTQQSSYKTRKISFENVHNARYVRC